MLNMLNQTYIPTVLSNKYGAHYTIDFLFIQIITKHQRNILQKKKWITIVQLTFNHLMKVKSDPTKQLRNSITSFTLNINFLLDGATKFAISHTQNNFALLLSSWDIIFKKGLQVIMSNTLKQNGIVMITDWLAKL